jgi:hypothetical protein
MLCVYRKFTTAMTRRNSGQGDGTGIRKLYSSHFRTSFSTKRENNSQLVDSDIISIPKDLDAILTSVQGGESPIIPSNLDEILGTAVGSGQPIQSRENSLFSQESFAFQSGRSIEDDIATLAKAEAKARRSLKPSDHLYQEIESYRN